MSISELWAVVQLFICKAMQNICLVSNKWDIGHYNLAGRSFIYPLSETSLKSCVFKPVACQGSSTCSDISCCRYRVTLREGAQSCGAPVASAGLAVRARDRQVQYSSGLESSRPGRLRLRAATEEEVCWGVTRGTDADPDGSGAAVENPLALWLLDLDWKGAGLYH